MKMVKWKKLTVATNTSGGRWRGMTSNRAATVYIYDATDSGIKDDPERWFMAVRCNNRRGIPLRVHSHKLANLKQFAELHARQQLGPLPQVV